MSRSIIIIKRLGNVSARNFHFPKPCVDENNVLHLRTASSHKYVQVILTYIDKTESILMNNFKQRTPFNSERLFQDSTLDQIFPE